MIEPSHARRVPCSSSHRRCSTCRYALVAWCVRTVSALSRPLAPRDPAHCCDVLTSVAGRDRDAGEPGPRSTPSTCCLLLRLRRVNTVSHTFGGACLFNAPAVLNKILGRNDTPPRQLRYSNAGHPLHRQPRVKTKNDTKTSSPVESSTSDASSSPQHEQRTGSHCREIRERRPAMRA